MSKIYTDYINRIALTIPDRFIDVKTGETHLVSPKVQEQIEYHERNNTLIHLVFSALTNYLHSKSANGATAEILSELAEIKRMMEQGYTPANQPKSFHSKDHNLAANAVDMKEVEDVLEAFGG